MKKILPILKYIFIVAMIILSYLLIKNVTDLNVLPTKYYVILLTVIIVLNVGGAILLLLKKVWTKIVGGIIYSLLLIISLIGIFSLGDVNKFLNKAFNNNTIEISTYKVVALKSSKYEKIEDLKDKDPLELYEMDCKAKGFKEDRCQLYLFRMAVYYASNEKHDKEKLKWWYWKD